MITNIWVMKSPLFGKYHNTGKTRAIEMIFAVVGTLREHHSQLPSRLSDFWNVSRNVKRENSEEWIALTILIRERERVEFIVIYIYRQT